MKNLRTWIVVVDGARAQLFIQKGSDGGWAPAQLQGLPAPEDRVQSHTEKSDRPGRSFSSSGGGIRHALESHSDYRKLEKHKFARAVADALNHAALAQEFDQLVLIAPPRSVGELRQSLSQQVQSSMRVVEKDLTKAPFEQIREEVNELLRYSRLGQPD
jgi:protein required for attachment to host cells